MFKKRKENSSQDVHNLHKTLHQEVSCRRRAVNVKEVSKKCHKKRDARASCCFAHTTNCVLRCRSQSPSQPFFGCHASRCVTSKKRLRGRLCRSLSESIQVSGKLPTYPSPKLTLTLTSRLGQNDSLGEGRREVSQKRFPNVSLPVSH